MKKVVFLTCRMAQGYGVDMVVHELCKELEQRGYRCFVGCHERTAAFPGANVTVLEQTFEAVESYVDGIRPHYVVAHTSPFFEWLPRLSTRYVRIAYEHGDPTPELFQADAAERRTIKEHKRKIVYPQINDTVAISQFIAEDIGYPAARVLYNGSDHGGPCPPLKRLADLSPAGAPLKIGTLMRMGAGEAHYKGNDLALAFCRKLKDEGIPFAFQVMGRGTPADAEPFEALGAVVHLNASDAEKAVFLRSLDLFISFSLWEGFNLPIAEAFHSGTLALSWDTGAHPEICPITCSSQGELVKLVEVYARDRALLLAHTVRATEFHRQRFRWRETGEAFAAHLYHLRYAHWHLRYRKQREALRNRLLYVPRKLRAARRLGPRGAAVKIMHKLSGKT